MRDICNIVNNNFKKKEEEDKVSQGGNSQVAMLR